MATVTMGVGVGVGRGGWAAIARKEAPVEKKPDIQSLLSTAGLKTVVVDANAIIGGGIRLRGIADQFFTVQEVLTEIRDPASRFHLATLPIEIKCLEPSEEALTKVAQFARATGDVQSLSDVDLKVIALTYTLEAQVHGIDHIRTRPPPLVLTPAKGGQGTKDPPGWGSVPNPEEWEGIEDVGEDANTGSRILGLKSLSLDTPESNTAGDSRPFGPNFEEVIVSSTVHDPRSNASITAEVGKSDPVASENHEQTPDADVNVETVQREPVVDSPAVHEPKSYGITPAEVHKFTPVVDKNHRETPRAPTVERTQTEPLQVGDSNKIPDTLGGVSERVESRLISKGEADADGDEWQRAISRSTRRQYLKRAQKRALRQQLTESLSANEARVTESEELKGMKSAKEHSDEGSAQEAAFFRSDGGACIDNAKVEGKLEYGDSDHDGDSLELTDEGLYEDEAGIEEAESADDEGNYHNDTASNADATSSVVDTEQSWSVTPMWTSSVACITSDYAMQNVILQMGLRLLSPSGQHIKELNKWVLKCQACFKVTTETHRMFCPKCGNGGTLFKVSITVGPNGCVLAGRNRRPILRGTKYSLPLPKGGREGALLNPVLREDQLPTKPRKVKKPEFEAFSSSDVVFALPQEKKGQKAAGVKAAAAIFSGRRNPNERRRSHK